MVINHCAWSQCDCGFPRKCLIGSSLYIHTPHFNSCVHLYLQYRHVTVTELSAFCPTNLFRTDVSEDTHPWLLLITKLHRLMLVAYASSNCMDDMHVYYVWGTATNMRQSSTLMS